MMLSLVTVTGGTALQAPGTRGVPGASVMAILVTAAPAVRYPPRTGTR